MRKLALVVAVAVAMFAAPVVADANVADKFDLTISGRLEVKATHNMDDWEALPAISDPVRDPRPGPHGRFWLDLNPTFKASNESIVVGRVRLGGPAFQSLTSERSGSFFHGGVFTEFDLDRLYVQNDSAWWSNGPVIRTRVGRQEAVLGIPDLYQPTGDGIYLSTNIRDWTVSAAYIFQEGNDDNALGLRAAGNLGDVADLGLTLVRSNGADDVLQWAVDIDAEVAEGVGLGGMYLSGHDRTDRTVGRSAWQVHGSLAGRRWGWDNWSFNARYRDVEDDWAARFGGSDNQMFPVWSGDNQARFREDDGTHWQVGAHTKFSAGPLNNLLFDVAVRGFKNDMDEDKVGYAVDLGWAPGNGFEMGLHYTSEWQGRRTYYGPSSGMYYYLPQDKFGVTAGWRVNF